MPPSTADVFPRKNNGNDCGHHGQHSSHQCARRGNGAIDRRPFHERANNPQVFLGFNGRLHAQDFVSQSFTLQDKVAGNFRLCLSGRPFVLLAQTHCEDSKSRREGSHFDPQTSSLRAFVVKNPLLTRPSAASACRLFYSNARPVACAQSAAHPSRDSVRISARV